MINVHVAEVDDTEGRAPAGLEDLRVRRWGFWEVHGEGRDSLGGAHAHERVAELLGRGARGVYSAEVLP
jgi:hypothetical protein